VAEEIKDDVEVSGGWIEAGRRIWATREEVNKLEAAGISLEVDLTASRKYLPRRYDPYTLHDAEGNNITARAREIVTPILGEPRH